MSKKTAAAGRRFSIITTCMGRLDHLRESLPGMLAQSDAEVIVVDYSCPDRTADLVGELFPAAKLVKVEGQEQFSNWRARNAGAAAASGDILLFCDADVILASDATTRLAAELPDGAFGFFRNDRSREFNRGGPVLGLNQLKGFHVIPADAFRRLGGYDEVLEGYAAGADTDLEDRLLAIGLAKAPLDPAIVERTIVHDNQARLRFHGQPIRVSYAAGLIYRRLKLALMRIRLRDDLDPQAKQSLYDTARKTARLLRAKSDSVSVTVEVASDPVTMPRQLGYAEATMKLTIKVELSGKGPIDRVPQ